MEIGAWSVIYTYRHTNRDSPNYTLTALSRGNIHRSVESDA